jgi:dihydrofolate reductase
MRKIIALTHLTLDGVMQSPGGPEEDPRDGFKHGGWSMAFGDEVVGDALDRIMSQEFDLLLGRRTYDIFAGYWPHAAKDNPIARAFNRAKKYVATARADRLPWEQTQRLEGDAVGAVRRLKESGDGEWHVWGSGNLLQTLIAADLIDEFRLWIYPVVLGEGRRLFENGVPSRGLTLVESRRGSKGVLFNTYRPTGPIS